MFTLESIMFTGMIIALLFCLLTLVCSINKTKKVLELHLFADYTKRYQEIMLHLPEKVHAKNFDYGRREQDEILRYMRAYFDLCSEEYDLHRQKLIDQKMWDKWEEGMKSAFSKKAFLEAWEMVSLDFFYYKEFIKFVNESLLPDSKIQPVSN